VFHRWERGGVFIVLRARRGHSECEAIGEDEDRGAKAFVDVDARPQCLAQDPGKRYAIPFDDQVNVEIGPSEEEIPDESSHDVEGDIVLVRQDPGTLQEGIDTHWQIGPHEATDVASG
jgi:hypothetical protein